jgi:hypothetical protein
MKTGPPHLFLSFILQYRPEQSFAPAIFFLKLMDASPLDILGRVSCHSEPEGLDSLTWMQFPDTNYLYCEESSRFILTRLPLRQVYS